MPPTLLASHHGPRLQLSESSRPFSASVGDRAKRDERFYLLPDQVYDLVAPKRAQRYIMSVLLQ